MGARERFYADIMATHPEVTGSCNLVVVKFPDDTTTRFIVDCGMFQETKYNDAEEGHDYNKDFPFNAEEIEFCLITHVHVDHVGRLPLLVKQGFRGKIYSTAGTKVLSNPAILDSAKVIRNTAKRKHVKPLYMETDAELALNLFTPCQYKETIKVSKRIKATFFKNGHLPGAVCILVQISYPGQNSINLLFTGDYNNKNMFLDIPEQLPSWVRSLPLTVIQESTYGTTDSTSNGKCFEDNMIRCLKHGGTAVDMVFSLGRAQEILYVLKTMQDSGKLDTGIPIAFDGNLAHHYTRLYQNADELNIRSGMRDFLPENLIFVDRTSRASVLTSNEQKIIVTTAGMGSYGPAQMYIPEYITRKNCLLQFSGYTAPDTLGGKLKSTPVGKSVEIGSIIRKKEAEVAYTTEFSAHAKADEMIDFLKQFESLKLVLVNHGEANTKIAFAERIVEEVDTKYVAILGREYMFRVNGYGLVRQFSSKFK